MSKNQGGGRGKASPQWTHEWVRQSRRYTSSHHFHDQTREKKEQVLREADTYYSGFISSLCFVGKNDDDLYFTATERSGEKKGKKWHCYASLVASC